MVILSMVVWYILGIAGCLLMYYADILRYKKLGLQKVFKVSDLLLLFIISLAGLFTLLVGLSYYKIFKILLNLTIITFNKDK